jgi:hypothetical protein
MRRIVPIFLCVVSVGCSGSITSVDGSKKTNALSPTDKAQLCEDTFNYVVDAFSADDIARLACGFGATDSGGASSCQSDFDKCVSETAKQASAPLEGAKPNCTGFNASIAKCNVTVDQYTQCLEEQLDAMKTLIDKAPFCTESAITSASIGLLGSLSAECIQLISTCTISFAPGPTGSSDSASSGP